MYLRFCDIISSQFCISERSICFILPRASIRYKSVRCLACIPSFLGLLFGYFRLRNERVGTDWVPFSYCFKRFLFFPAYLVPCIFIKVINFWILTDEVYSIWVDLWKYSRSFVPLSVRICINARRERITVITKTHWG